MLLHIINVKIVFTQTMAESLLVAISSINQTCKIVPVTIPTNDFKLEVLLIEHNLYWSCMNHHTKMILSTF